MDEAGPPGRGFHVGIFAVVWKALVHVFEGVLETLHDVCFIEFEAPFTSHVAVLFGNRLCWGEKSVERIKGEEEGTGRSVTEPGCVAEGRDWLPMEHIFPRCS